ncbi:MAG: response regulator, partial [Gammaproteobacteria bacterium]
RGLVAVIEDDDIARTALGRLLAAAGFEHALFASAETFLASERNCVWLCLIVDVQLTGMSGRDLQWMLRHEGSEAPVIIITANRADAIRERAEQAGCAAFLTKPCEGDAILALLGSLAR